MALVRLQKFLAEAGVASRRAGEKIILEGRVSVNGRIVKELGTRVDPRGDKVLVDGQPIKAKRKLYIALNKPRRYLCSKTSEGNKQIVFDLLPKEWTDLFTVGRLDFESEGLLFLSNDGDFCLKLTHPRYEVSKIYVAIVEGWVDPPVVKKMIEGITYEGDTLKAHRAHIISANKTSSTIELELREGKNREVRRLFESQGFEVKRLVRTRIGNIKLGELPTGKWRALTDAEIKSLLPKT